MNIMIHKGYAAKINFDGRDNIFWGKVIGIKDSITFEGETVDQLIEDFHNAMDHYLADCKQEGHTPDKAYFGLLFTNKIIT
jgi:predicted HicB family RNase H-like nuclease